VFIETEGVVGGVGNYGPFADGRTVPYIDWLDGDGGGVFRATVADGVASPDVLTRGRAKFNLRRKDDGKMALQLAGFQPELAAAA
jgi:hypothetical protein